VTHVIHGTFPGPLALAAVVVVAALVVLVVRLLHR